MLPFLERVPAFDLVIRFNLITYPEAYGPKITESLLVEDLKVWWAMVNSADVLTCLKQTAPYGEHILIKELILFWNRQQAGKDQQSQAPSIMGRNFK